MQPQSQLEHLSEDALEAYSRGALDEIENAGMEEHLLVCAVCQARLDEIDTYLRAARHAAAELRREGREMRRWHGERRLWPILAAGLVAFSIAIFLPWRTGQTQPVHEIELRVERGAARTVMIQAPAGKPLALNLDLTELRPAPEYRLELVNSSGSPMWASLVKGESKRLHATLPFELAAGVYWVRLYVPNPTPLLLREYGLQAL